MKKGGFTLSFIFFIIFSSNRVLSQNKSFVVLSSQVELSQSELKKIEQHSFDEYRFFNIRKKVQIVRGPLIELLSVSELQKLGVSFSKEYLDQIRLRSESFKHESIMNLDLGIGVYPAYEPK